MIKTTGIVLRNFKYKETSLIVDIYTLDTGLRSFIVNGVRKSKSKLSANYFQVMSQLDLLMYPAKDGTLNRFKEIKSHKLYKQIPFDIVRSLTGQFMVEILRKSIIDSEPNERLYSFIVNWFDFLDDTNESLKNIIPIFLIELAGVIGFAFIAEGNHSSYFDMQEGVFVSDLPLHKHYLSLELSAELKKVILSSKETAHLLEISSVSKNEIIDKLIVFYTLHMDGFKDIKSLQILRDIFR